MAIRMSLYEQAVDIATDYLGPAGERFMRRQVDTHLRKRPDEITAADVAKLVVWIKPTFALLTDNADMVESFTGRLLSLADKGRAHGKKTSVG